MAEGLNKVMLLGNLGADPELRTTQGGEAVLKFRLATTERYLDRNKAWQERTEWHNVVVWGKRGEGLHRILTRGSTIFVEGALRTSSYDDKDGVKRYRTEIVASNIILAGGRAGRGAGDEHHEGQAPPPPRAQTQARPPQGGQAPQQRGNQGGNQGGNQAPADEAPPYDDDGGYGGPEDDIPF